MSAGSPWPISIAMLYRNYTFMAKQGIGLIEIRSEWEKERRAQQCNFCPSFSSLLGWYRSNGNCTTTSKWNWPI